MKRKQPLHFSFLYGKYGSIEKQILEKTRDPLIIIEHVLDLCDKPDERDISIGED